MDRLPALRGDCVIFDWAMKNIRIGKDIVVRWTILTNGEALPLDGRDLRLECLAPGRTSSEIEFSRNGNVAEFTIQGVTQHRVGKYVFTMWENFGKEGQTAVDCCDAFNLVYTTCEEGGDETDGLNAETVNLETADLQVTASSVIQRTFCIHTKKVNDNVDSGPYDFYTVIEGVSDEDLKVMSDTDQYRICLLRLRKHACEGRRWRIPMLPYELARRKTGSAENVISAILETDTWWPVTGRIVPWFRDGRKLPDVIQLTTTEPSSSNRKVFCSTRNVKMRIGVALFRRTGRGGEGWTRVSNISAITLLLTASDNIVVNMEP